MRDLEIPLYLSLMMRRASQTRAVKVAFSPLISVNAVYYR
jgi:hypothetical protein